MQGLLLAEVVGGAQATALKSSFKSLSRLWKEVRTRALSRDRLHGGAMQSIGTEGLICYYML